MYQYVFSTTKYFTFVVTPEQNLVDLSTCNATPHRRGPNFFKVVNLPVLNPI